MCPKGLILATSAGGVGGRWLFQGCQQPGIGERAVTLAAGFVSVENPKDQCQAPRSTGFEIGGKERSQLPYLDADTSVSPRQTSLRPARTY